MPPHSQVAPNIGHADHMSGLNYTKMGLWHETAGSMDSATRVELRCMNQQLALSLEDLERHSTHLIDTKGRVHWKRPGGKLFADVEFLLQSIKRMNQQAK